MEIDYVDYYLQLSLLIVSVLGFIFVLRELIDEFRGERNIIFIIICFGSLLFDLVLAITSTKFLIVYLC